MFSSLLILSAAILTQSEAVPENKALAAEVKRLVQQLDDAAQPKRDAAEKTLIERGPDVLPLLPTITPRTPAEIKERLGRVRKSLETALSDASAKPTVVTLNGDMLITDAMEAITKQTGNKMTGFERRTNSLKLAFDKKPFWPALDELLDQAELNINPYGGEANTLVLVAKADGEEKRAGRATYSGVFRFEVLRIEARRDLVNPAVNSMRVTVGVAWEPRITPIALRQPIDKIAATDEKGTSLAIRTEETQGVLNASAETGMSAVELGVPLELPARGVEKIGSIKGTLTALVPGRLESFEFTDLETSRDAELQRAGVSVIFERLRKNGDLFEVRVRVRYDAASNALESHRGWVYANPAYIVDKDGQRIESLGANEGGREENEIGIVLLYDLPNGPKGCKFVYQTPASMLQLPVEYEIKDIPLP